jgi:hypothetical protein
MFHSLSHYLSLSTHVHMCIKIHREEDGEVIKLLDAAKGFHRAYYMIDAHWITRWKEFVFDEGVQHQHESQSAPPGFITNENLLYFRVASKKHLKLVEDAARRQASTSALVLKKKNQQDLFAFGSWNRFALNCDESGKLTVKVREVNAQFIDSLKRSSFCFVSLLLTISTYTQTDYFFFLLTSPMKPIYD